MKKLFACVACFGLSALAAAAAGEGKAPKIEGDWNITGGSQDGKKIPQEIFDKIMAVATFKDGKYSVAVMGKKVEAGTYKIEAKKKTSNIDLTMTEGKDKDKMQLGILKIEGDVMTLVVTKVGAKDRPKNFDDGADIQITIMKRSK